MPTDWGTGWVLVDQRHRERFGLDTGPARDLLSQWNQKSRQRRRNAIRVVGVAKERDSPAGDDAAHLERGELDFGNLSDQGLFFRWRDEAALIPKAVRYVRFEKRT